MERTKTAKAGCEFAAQMVLEFGRDKILPVNIDSLVQQTISIPEEDYRNLQLLGIDPDPQEYWEGQKEECLVIEIIGEIEEASILQLAKKIKGLNEQASVLVTSHLVMAQFV